MTPSRGPAAALAFVAAPLACLVLSAIAAAGEPPRGFALEEIAPGVHAAIRREPAGMMFDANNLLIVNDEDVVVVDANATAASSREVIAALRRLTAKPVRYLVNTHWHLDHFEGNEAWREAWPGIEIIGHPSTREDLAGIGAGNRRGLLEHGPAMARALRERLAGGRDREGRPLDSETRAALASDAAQAERYFAATANARMIPPTIEVADRLVLRRGERTIEIRHLGAGHTRADLVVWLPRERIVATGDLVAAPVPLIGNTASPLDYPATLDALLGLGAATFVPGHGPVMRGDAYVRQVASLATAIRDGAKAAVSRGESLAETRASVDLSAHRRAFAGGSKVREALFEMYVAQPAVAGAWRQAGGRERPAAGALDAGQPERGGAR